MAIQFVGGAVAGKAGATSGNTTIALNSGLTGGIASSVSAGDLVIAAMCMRRDGVPTASATITDGTNNYTLIGGAWDHVDFTRDGHLGVGYKFMGSTPDTAVTFGPTGNNQIAAAMAVYVFRGVDTGTIFDVTSQVATGTGTFNCNPPAITPTTSGAFVVCVGMSADGVNGTNTFTASDLVDMLSIGGNDNQSTTIGVAHKDDWSSGEFNPAAWSSGAAGDNTANAWIARTIALRPASSATPLTANDVESASAMGTKPVITQKHNITANDVASLSEVTKPAIHQLNKLYLTSNPTSLSEVTKPALTILRSLLAENVESLSEVTKPAVHQKHTLDAVNPASLSEVTKPQAHQKHVLDATNAEANSEVTKPAVHQKHALDAQNVEAASEVTKPDLDEANALDAVNVESASDLTDPAIHQKHTLTATNNRVASSSTVQPNPSIKQKHTLDAANAESASELTQPTLVENAENVDVLFANDAESNSELSKPDVHQHHLLAATNNRVASSSTVTKPSLSARAGLSAEDVESASEVSAPAISQHHELSAQDIESGSEVTKPVAASEGEQPVVSRRGGGIRMRPQEGEDREARHAHRGVLKLIRDALKTEKRSKPSAAQLTHAAEVILQYPDLEAIDLSELSRAVGHIVADIGIQPSRTMLVGRFLQLAYEAQVEEDDEEVLEMLFDQEIETLFNSDLEGMWT